MLELIVISVIIPRDSTQKLIQSLIRWKRTIMASSEEVNTFVNAFSPPAELRNFKKKVCRKKNCNNWLTMFCVETNLSCSFRSSCDLTENIHRKGKSQNKFFRLRKMWGKGKFCLESWENKLTLSSRDSKFIVIGILSSNTQPECWMLSSQIRWVSFNKILSRKTFQFLEKCWRKLWAAHRQLALSFT